MVAIPCLQDASITTISKLADGWRKYLRGGNVSPMTKTIDIAKIKKDAETYYRNGDYFCSEAIIKAIKDGFAFAVS